jgi:hypothetical protein
MLGKRQLQGLAKPHLRNWKVSRFHKMSRPGPQLVLSASGGQHDDAVRATGSHSLAVALPAVPQGQQID